MQSCIYLILAFVAFTAAKQLNLEPKVFSGTQSPSSSSQKTEKRYATREYILYLAPDEIKDVQEIKGSENKKIYETSKESQSEQQNVDEKQIKWYNSRFAPEAPQLEIRGLAAHEAFFQKQQENPEVQQGNYKHNSVYSEERPKEQAKEISNFPETSEENLENYYSWQKEEEVKSLQESELHSGDKWKPYYTSSAETQEDIKLNEQLNKQWNRILDHNRVQLKSLSPALKESQGEKKVEKPEETLNSKSELEKEIESILKTNQGYELLRQGKISQAELIKQSLPIVIHKEVSVTQYHLSKKQK